MSSRVIKPLWDMVRLPLHFGVCKTPSNHPFPDWLPFVLGVDAELGLLVQCPNQAVVETLRKVYAHNSQIGAAMQAGGLGRTYCDSFLGFVNEALGPGGVAGKRLLELGCGSGYMLERLRDLGASVLGVEPGNAFADAAGRGVTILNCEFEQCRFDKKFDLILHYGVAEHMADPLDFFNRQTALLAEGGSILFAVPNCAPFIEQGDLSVFIHEHWNYFTGDALARLAAAVGADVRLCVKADVGNVLYAHWTKGSKRASVVNSHDWQAAVSKFQHGRQKVEQWFSHVAQSGKTVGVFAPSRLLNYMSSDSRFYNDIRLFDDNADWYGNFVPPLAAPVENRAALLRKPVDCLLIMSRAFGRKIASSLREQGLPTQTRIVLIEELI